MHLLFKHIYRSFYIVLFSGFFFTSSCKKDLGNYEYFNPVIPNLENAGLNAVYNVNQNEVLSIKPTIEFGGNESDLKYEWIAYRSGIIAVIGPPALIATTRDLNSPIPLPPGGYFIELIVTDTKTLMKRNVRATLNVLAPIESGWMVLHTLNNESEVDFIVTNKILPSAVNKHMRNMVTASTGSKVAGEGRFITQTRRGNSDFNYFNIATSNNFMRTHGFTFTYLNKNEQLFRRPTILNPQAQLSNATYEFLINDGKLYTIGNAIIQDAQYSAPFRGDYYLAPYMTCSNINIYGAVVYDQISRRFMYSTVSGLAELNFATFKPQAPNNLLFDMNNVGKDLLFMERGFSDYTYAFFKDVNGDGRFLYVINFSKADDGNLAVAKYDFSGITNIQSAKFFDVGSLGNVALYATENKIYKYDYSGTNQATLLYDLFASNEVITSMKICKAKLNANNSVADFNNTNNTVVFVATWNGTEGKLYELGINPANGVINSIPLNTYTGFGKIQDMNFKFRGAGT